MRVGPGGRHPGGASRRPSAAVRNQGNLTAADGRVRKKSWRGASGRMPARVGPVCVSGYCATSTRSGAIKAVSSSAERSSNAQPLLVEAGFEPQGDLVQLRRVDPPGQFGQLARIEVAESLPLPVQLHFHQQDDLLKLGMGLRGAAEHQGLVAPGQPMMIIVAVQAKADQGGSDAARSCERLLRRDHLGVGLSRGDAEGRGMSSSDPSRSRSAAMLGTQCLSVCPRAANSPEIENRWRS